MLGSALTQFSRLAFATTALACMCLQGATAQQLASNVAPLGTPTTAPIGWEDFCQRYQQDCNVRELRPANIILDEQNWREIIRINAQVNREITPMTDKEHWGVAEQWDYPDDGKGDCEDYALEKRRRLMKAGFPRQALLMTVVRDHKGEGHAVLTVRTDRGDFILDNQAPKVLGWSETGYRFIKQQSQGHPNRWVSLGGFDTATVSASKAR